MTAFAAASVTANATSRTLCGSPPLAAAKREIRRRITLTDSRAAGNPPAKTGTPLAAAPPRRSSSVVVIRIRSWIRLARELCPFAELDDDQMVLVALDDFVDTVGVMPRRDDEPVEVRADRLVVAQGHVDHRVAAGVAALTDEGATRLPAEAAFDCLIRAAAVDLDQRYAADQGLMRGVLGWLHRLGHDRRTFPLANGNANAKSLPGASTRS